MNGRVVASERPGHSILEGTMLLCMFSSYSPIPSSQPPRCRCRPLRIQLPRRRVWLEPRALLRCWERDHLEARTEHTSLLHRSDQDRFRGAEEERHPWRGRDPGYGRKGGRGERRRQLGR